MATATLYPSRSGGVEASVIEGITKSLTAHYQVTGLTSSDEAALLSEVLNATNLPGSGDFASNNTNLQVQRRDVKILPDKTADVTVHYARLADIGANFYFSGGTSLVQTTTQSDIYGNQIIVSHSYPSSHENPNLAGKTVSQGGDVSVLIPQTTFTATGQLSVYYPDEITRLWAGSMNSAIWAASPPYTWMCTRCDFTPLQIGLGQTPFYEFTFEFQNDINTWIPLVYFVDPDTGKPPANIVAGTGTKPIDWYGLLDFNILFPNT